MSNEMTKEQEEQLKVYHDKFLKRGLSTERLDVGKATEAVLSLYKILDKELKEDYEVKVFDSPEAMCKFASDITGRPASSFISDINFGNVDNYWVSSVSFINNVLGITKEEEKVRVAEQVTEHCGPFLMFDDGILLSQRPTKICLLEDNKTRHREDGPAIDHADGLSRSWFLNDVEVTEKIVMTKPEDFTKEDILNEKNADVRREIVRKIPAETLVKILKPNTVDEKFGYDLLGIDLGDDRVRPFLKMENPTIGTVHIEGVAPDCNSVEDSIVFRNQLSKFGLPKTLDGKELFGEFVADYEQQGDCLAFPEGSEYNSTPFTASILDNAKKLDHNVVATGLISHVGTNCEVYKLDGRFFLKAGKDCTVRHNKPEPDHEDMSLAEGVWEIKKVLEYDHWLEESREVID